MKTNVQFAVSAINSQFPLSFSGKMYYNIKWTVVHAAEGDPAVAEKKRISVRIAGRFLSMMTDEDAESVREIEKTRNTQVE